MARAQVKRKVWNNKARERERDTYRMFLSRIFTLCILSNDGKVYILVSNGPVARKVPDQSGGSIDIQILPNHSVPRHMTQWIDRSV